MPVICQTFVENAWKKDLCSNCFKSSEEHAGQPSKNDHKPLTGQDSLTELQLGTNRYFTLSSTQFIPNSRYTAQISKWNDTVFQHSIEEQDHCSKITEDPGQLSNNLSITSNSATQSLGTNEDNSETSSSTHTLNNNQGGASNSLSDKMKETTNHTVIERLDSLVLGTPLNSLEIETQREGADLNTTAGSKTGILKDSKKVRASPEKKRGITFPDYEELQEIIGYGGDMYYSSDEDDAKEPDRKSETEYSDELTQEERNVVNITKKNTSFNSHAQNLKDPSGSPLPKLGVDKKHTPIISVRPFVREHTPGRVNMVSPMINGEVVTTVTTRNNKDNSSSKPTENSKLFNSVRKLDQNDGSGRGEINTKTNKQDSLGSDGSTENSSSDSDSNTRDSPPPSDISFTSFDMKNKEISRPSPESYKKQSSFLSSQIEEQKAKSTAATARLSFLSNYPPLPKSDISTHKVKPSNYMDEHVTILSAAKAKLSLPNKNSSLGAGREVEDDQAPIEQQKAKSTAATARLSFLNSTINGNSKSELNFSPTKVETETELTPLPVSAQISEDKSEAVQDDENPADKSQVPKNGPEKVTSTRSESCRDSPKVKLTRKSPYVVGPYASTAILKGTPKPMITRKPPILKDKPKVPLKPNKLMMRSPSSSPSPSPSPHEAKRSSQAEGEKEDATDCSRPKRNSSPDKKSDVAAPREASFRQKSEAVAVTLAAHSKETKSEDEPSISGARPGGEASEDSGSETIAVGHDRNNSLIISVSSVKTMLNDIPSSESHGIETTESCGDNSTKSENSPPQVQKNLANKNKEALEAIRKSLSNKLISSTPPAVVLESIKASESCRGSVPVNKISVEKTASNSFEENRASIADALQFNRHDNVARPSTKRQAPKPPDSTTDELEETEAPPLLEFYESPNETNDDPSNEKAEEIYDEPEVCPEPKLAPAIRNSSMKSEQCNKNKDSKPRTVQFSPETVTVTVPSANAVPKMISYNRWMGKSQNPYLESSFTGQPITMYPPGAISPPMKKPGVAYAPAPIVDDGPRKWTEKKNKWRSKSTPRSTEIDEIIGSSKTKTPNRLGIFAPSSPQPIKRQSRVEIYESEKKLQKKGKFSLKKLFKLQGVPDAMEDNTDNKFIDKEHEREILERQKVKVRPEIIHPLDLLNGGVEVVKITPKNSLKGHYEKHKNSKSAEKSAVKRHADLKAKLDSDSKDSGHDTSSIHTETSEGTTSSSGGDYSNTSVDFSPSLTPVGVVPQPPPEALLSSASREISASQGCLGVNSVGKPKPLPPPRSQSLETFEKNEGSEEVDFCPDVVITPHQGGSPTIIRHHRASSTPDQTVYANLGQLRSNLTPNKPQRTASMREANQGTESENVSVPPPPTEQEPSPAYISQGKINLGDVTIPSPNSSHPAHFHAKTSSITGSLNSEALSDSTISFPSSTARKAMDGSEADSERDSVSPQRLPDEGLYGEDDSPVTSNSNRKRVSRLSMRKGRSIVHKNLEDNYGAVITANHEAIAQILEQVCQNRPTPSSLKTLASAMNLRFADFSVLSESEGLRTEKRAFFPATWGSAHLPVTLMVSKDMALNNNNVKNPFSMTPIAQFVDQVPSYLLAQPTTTPGAGHSNNQAVVWALSRLQVLQFGTFAKNMKTRRKSLRVDEFEKDMSFILLQLINGLKFLQAQGIEETIADLDNFLLARSDNDTNHRLIITEECHKAGSSSTQTKMSLCQCALSAMLQLFDIPDPVGKACEPQQKIELPQIIPSVSMFKTMAVILQKDGGVSLGQVKSMLEFMLWGPSDIIFDFKMGREAESREEALQRWLDLERATVLNNLIRTQGLWNIHLTVYEEYHLLFLVRTCAKMLREASLLFESEVSRM